MNTYFQNDAQLAIPMKITVVTIVIINKIEIDLRVLVIGSWGGQTKSQAKTRLFVDNGSITIQIQLPLNVEITFLYRALSEISKWKWKRNEIDWKVYQTIKIFIYKSKYKRCQLGLNFSETWGRSRTSNWKIRSEN